MGAVPLPLKWNTWPRVAVIAGLSALVAVRLLPDALTLDDAFTHFRTAENVARGFGPVYDVGGATIGSTSVLYTMVLGGLIAATGIDTLHLAAALHVAAVIGLGAQLRSLAGAAPWAALAWLAPCLFASRQFVSMCAGMEMPWLAVLGLWALRCALAGRVRWLGVACVALCLLRPDGIVFAAAAFALAWWRARRVPWATAAVALVVAAPWLGYALVRFGGILPMSATAKFAHGRTGMWTSFGRELPANLLANFGWWWLVAAAVGTIAAVRQRRTAELAVLAAAVLYALAAALAGAPSYAWYLQPTLLAVCVAIVVAAQWAGACAFRRAPRWLPCGVVLVTLAALATPWGTPLRRERAWPESLVPEADRYVSLARFIRANAAPTDRLGTLEIGILGYYTGLTQVDFCGLVTPGVAARFPSRSHIAYCIDELAPEFVIAHHPDSGLEAGLPERLQRHYFCVRRLADCSVWRRADPVGVVAERLVRAARARAAHAVAFVDFPAALDWAACAAAVQGLAGAEVRLERSAVDSASPWLAVLTARGEVAVQPRADFAATVYGPEAIDRWTASAVVATEATPAGLRRTAVSAPSVLHARLDLAGPLRRVRVRAALGKVPTGAPPTSTAYVAWTSSDRRELDRHDLAAVVVRGELGEQDLVFELPLGRLTADAVLRDLYLQPFGIPCTFTVSEVICERLP